ncbi:CpaF family protein [Lacibacterium aquatile]|uniref:CpaF family protein n=1 Tax=Lacibacterium aquatile TaxID=1168082 RepID=A0ABW5DVF3_9PROT
MTAFGKRAQVNTDSPAPAIAATAPVPTAAPIPAPRPADPSPPLLANDSSYGIKTGIFAALIETIDLAELSKMDAESTRSTLHDIISEIIAVKGYILGPDEQEAISAEILNDILGLGPLEPLLARDDIADIMVNGCDQVYIEVDGLIQLTPVKFRDNAQLMNICQRIVASVGRRVDEASPICDARLADGSRVNVIVHPLSLKGPTLTIRKFKKDKLTLDQMVQRGGLSPEAASLLRILSAARCNILISGGTGSGKTTLLNCLTQFFSPGERIVTCEDAAELQLQQPHVVSLETRPPNLEGKGEIAMRDLVRNCLRMRPDRIVVGEVRGAEAFDLLQAMNTGHDGSMGTLHANTPTEALGRLENMIAMGNLPLSPGAVRKQIADALNIVVQTQRLRDGSRRITHVTEILSYEDDRIQSVDLMTFLYTGDSPDGRIQGHHAFLAPPRDCMENIRAYGLERECMALFTRGDG